MSDDPPAPPPPDPPKPVALTPLLRAALLARLPPTLRGGVADPRRRGALALLGLAFAGAVGGAVVLMRARPAETVVAPLEVQRPEPSPTAAAVLVIDVSGGVRRPGLVRLRPGSRVADAIAAAGGLQPGASTAGLNLARRLVDGEQVLVARAGDRPAAPPAGAAPAPGGRLDLNLATLDQLDALPGVGPVLAQRIVDWRTEHGRFATVDQLREVTGIGEKRFQELSTLVTV